MADMEETQYHRDMQVKCDVSETTLTDDNDRDVDGVVATCSRCDHSTSSFGTGDNSKKRCLVLLREECPRNEKNFYVAEGD